MDIQALIPVNLTKSVGGKRQQSSEDAYYQAYANPPWLTCKAAQVLSLAIKAIGAIPTAFGDLMEGPPRIRQVQDERP